MYISPFVMSIRFERLISHITSGNINAAQKMCDKYIALYKKEEHSHLIDKYDIEGQLFHCSLLLLMGAGSVAHDVCITMKQLVDDELVRFNDIKTFLGNPLSTEKDIGTLEVLPMLVRDEIINIVRRDYY